MSTLKALEAAAEAATKPKRARTAGRTTPRRRAKKKDVAPTPVAAPATRAQTAAGSGGRGRGGGSPPANTGTPSAGSGNFPVQRNNTLPRQAREKMTRQEKFMGNLQAEPRTALPGPVTSPKPKKSVAPYLAAGAAAGFGAFLYSSGEDKAPARPTVNTPPTAPAVSPAPRATAAPKPSPAPSPAPSPKPSAPKPKSKQASGSSSSGGRKLAGKNENMADFLGLSKDSEVRYYMETGKHRFPRKK